MIQYLVGDVFDRMAELEDNTVDLVLTSPPFLALRSYLPADHPNKTKEIGSESTPAEFVDVLLRLTAEWRRLLTPHGSICIELGDTYSGSGGAGGDYNEHGLRDGQPRWDGSVRLGHGVYVEGQGRLQQGNGWPLAKSLTLIPEAYRFALAYGLNPHTGQTSPAGQWRVRNVIRWVRPNPPVGALGDKFRPATSELVVAATGKDRWFDLDAVREPHQQPQWVHTNGPKSQAAVDGEGLGRGFTERTTNPAGAPPLDWCKISPKGYAGAHYAVWPSELCVKPIQAMCPREVCRECGEPRRRITEPSERYAEALGQGFNNHEKDAEQGQMQSIRDSERGTERRNALRDVLSSPLVSDRTTVGWSDCGHDNYRPGLVLDPFAGTGTTLAVAHGHGRDAIGIDIDERSAELARDRVGPLFLDIINA